MCAIPTLLANFEGSLAAETRDGVATLTSSGPVRYVDGAAPGSLAYVAEEGTTNLVPNPFASDVVRGWQTVNGSRVVVDGWQVITRTNPAGFLVVQTFEGVGGSSYGFTTVAAGATYTLSYDIRSPNSIDTFARVRYRDVSGDTLEMHSTDDEQETSPTTKRVTFTTTAPPDADTASLEFINPVSEVGTSYEVRRVQFEEKPYATSFCHGDMGAGYSWAGTVHASASTRAASSIVTDPTDLVSVHRGALVIRGKIPPWGEANNGPCLFRIGTGLAGADRLGMRTRNTSGGLFLQTRTNAGAFVTTPLPDMAVDTWHTFIAEWEGSTVRVHTNANPPVTHTRNAPAGSWGGVLDVGHAGGTMQLNNAVDGVALFDHPLTDAERTKLMNAPTWEWDTLIPRLGGIPVVPAIPVVPTISVVPVTSVT